MALREASVKQLSVDRELMSEGRYCPACKGDLCRTTGYNSLGKLLYKLLNQRSAYHIIDVHYIIS